jgi:hypothetical protein
MTLQITQAIDALAILPDIADPANFETKTNTLLVTELPLLQTELNTFAGQANALATEANANTVAAAASAVAAAASQVNAANYANIASAIANYKGLYGGLVGALAIPASTFYNNRFWALTQNTADVTADVPGVSAKWQTIVFKSATENGAGSVALTNNPNDVQRLAFTANFQYVQFPDATTCLVGNFTYLDNPTQFWGIAQDINNKIVGLIPPMSYCPVSLANNGTTGGKWRIGGGATLGLMAQLVLTGVSLGSTTVKLVAVPLDAQRTMIVMGGTALYAIVYNRATSSWGAATLVRAAIGSAGTFQAIKSAANQVLVVSCSSTTALEAVTLTTAGTGITVNSGTKATAVLAGNMFQTFSKNGSGDAEGMRKPYVFGAAFVFPYTRATVGAIVAITVAGTTPTIGAEMNTGLSTAQGADFHFYTSGANLIVICSGNIGVFTLAGVTFTSTGTVAYTNGTTWWRSVALGARWLVFAPGAAGAASAHLVNVAAGVPTISSVTSVLTSAGATAGNPTPPEADIQVCNGKAVVVWNNVDIAGNFKFNVLTDTAGTLSKGTELSLTLPTPYVQDWPPVALGTSGTDALFWIGDQVWKVSAAAASPTISGVNNGAGMPNYMAAAALKPLGTFASQPGSDRPPQIFYSGGLATYLPFNPGAAVNGNTGNFTVDQAFTVSVGQNDGGSTPFRVESSFALRGGDLRAWGVESGANFTWALNMNSTSEPPTLSCFGAVQP